MKNTIILISILFMMTGCGGDSGDKASTTNPVGINNSNNNFNFGNGTGAVGNGSTVTPTTPGVTPLSRGANEALRAELLLSYDVDSSGRATASGLLDMDQQSGFGNCTLPVGEYDISTSSSGVQKNRVHSYEGLTLELSGPVSVRVLVENSVAMQNLNGEWVLYAVLKVQSISGSACNSSLSFYMPLAQ